MTEIKADSNVVSGESLAQSSPNSVIDVASKLHQVGVISRIRELDFDFRRVPAPYVVELDPTAACDLACPGCISEDIVARGGRFSDERPSQTLSGFHPFDRLLSCVYVT